jgi:MFS family permease
VSASAKPRTPDDERRASARSLRGLDGLNFLMADVRDGLGPYLSVYLKGAQHWSPGDIGIAMAASSLSAALCQIPAGLLVDALRTKRMLVAASGLAVALGCMLIATFPQLATIIAAQVMIGAASAVIPPALAALSLGLVGRRRMDARISRNESFNHAGNFVAAALAGTLGQWLGYDWIFYLVCAFAAGSAAVVNLINSGEIDHDLARGGAEADPEAEASAQHKPIPIKELLTHRDLLVFLVSVVLFHFGNAAMLPMAGQVLAQTHPGWDTISLSGCIIVAQLAMVGIAWAVGKAMAAGYGRKTIFLIALAVLPVRGLLFSFTANPIGVTAIQLLDGVAAGIFGVIAIVLAADVTRGTGRFNLAQGLVALAVGLGAGLSNLVSGYIVQWFGYPIGFLSLAVIALVALIFFAVFMPETRDREARQARERRLAAVAPA